MEKIIIYGAGGTGRKFYNTLMSRNDKNTKILAFTDGDVVLWSTELFGIKIISPDEINNYDYDKIVVATLYYDEVISKLENELGIPREKIDTTDINASYASKNREIFLNYYADMVYDKKTSGSVAEGGVWRGDFAKHINALFPDRTLYLFDTFDGFDKRDIVFELEKGFSDSKINGYKFDSEEKVKAILPHPEKVIIHKGYFPETAKDVNDEFVFVNLDFDLYSPILAGLEFFYPKMVYGGVILVHDYFSDLYKGVKTAVDEFCEKEQIVCIPIADERSIAIVKQ